MSKNRIFFDSSANCSKLSDYVNTFQANVPPLLWQCSNLEHKRSRVFFYNTFRVKFFFLYKWPNNTFRDEKSWFCKKKDFAPQGVPWGSKKFFALNVPISTQYMINFRYLLGQQTVSEHALFVGRRKINLTETPCPNVKMQTKNAQECETGGHIKAILECQKPVCDCAETN